MQTMRSKWFSVHAWSVTCARTFRCGLQLSRKEVLLNLNLHLRACKKVDEFSHKGTFGSKSRCMDGRGEGVRQ
jgi:hypothetical protein